MNFNSFYNPFLPKTEPSDFFAAQTAQLAAFQAMQLNALIAGQNQADQLADFISYQNAQKQQLISYQQAQVADPNFSILDLLTQEIITILIFPGESLSLHNFQTAQFASFQAFQSSQAHLYPWINKHSVILFLNFNLIGLYFKKNNEFN